MLRKLVILACIKLALVNACLADDLPASEAPKAEEKISIAAYLGDSYVSQAEWNGVVKDYGKLDISEDEAKNLISLHSTVTGEKFAISGGVPAALEKDMIKAIHDLHVRDRKWADIGYHFIVGQSGKVYEGRPYHFMGSHTLSLNKRNLGVAFLGCFDRQGCQEDGHQVTEVSAEMLDSAAKLIAVTSYRENIDISKESVVLRSSYDLAKLGKTRFPYSPGQLISERLDELVEMAQNYRRALEDSSCK